jgi:hypothetical protein
VVKTTTKQKLWLVLDEAEKRMLRARRLVTMADDCYEEVCEALEKVVQAKLTVQKEIEE